jgi:hypothetical protein
MVPKLFTSRVFLDSMIATAISRSNEDREAVKKQLDEFV